LFKSREFRGVYGLTYDLEPKAPPGERVSNIRLTGSAWNVERGASSVERKPTAEDGECSGRSLERQRGQTLEGEAPPERVRVAFNSYDMASAGGRLLRLRAILDQRTSRLEEYPDADTRDAVLAYFRVHQPLDIPAAPGAHVVGAR